jgi:protein FRG1
MGPVMLSTSVLSKLACVCSFADSTDISLDLLDSEVQNLEPETLGQVWQTYKIDPSRPTIVSFKSPNSKYIGVDKYGVVSCEREAIGPTEEWETILRPDGFGFKSMFDKFLSIDTEAFAKHGTAAGGIIRADSETMGARETFHIRMQNRFKRQAKKSAHVNVMAAEQEKIKQQVGHKQLKFSSQDRLDIRKAAEQGRLGETLLDKRSQKTSDKYCK